MCSAAAPNPERPDGPSSCPSFLMVSAGYPPVQRAGLEYGCQRLSEALVLRGHTVTVLTMNAPGRADQEVLNGVRVLRVLRPRGRWRLWAWSYRRQVRRWLTRLLPEWDLVMCHQLYLHSVEANAVARSHNRCSCHLLVAAQEYSDVTRLSRLRDGPRLVQQAISGADALFVLSAISRRELAVAGAPPSRIHDYRYFVDSDHFAPDDSPPARELLWLGRFHSQKNLPLMLEAFDRLSRTVADVRLRIVGAGPEETALRAAVESLSATRRVIVEPWASDPRERYRRAWALVQSSDAEGLSNVLLEALASGLPVVTTDVSGAREALDLEEGSIGPSRYLRGAGGLLVPMRDPDALCAALRDVLERPELRASLSRDARHRAVTVFSERTCVGRFLDVVTPLARCG